MLQGFFGGQPNSIQGKIKELRGKQKKLFRIIGRWDRELLIHPESSKKVNMGVHNDMGHFGWKGWKPSGLYGWEGDVGFAPWRWLSFSPPSLSHVHMQDKKVFFDPKDHVKWKKLVRRLDRQEPNESRRCVCLYLCVWFLLVCLCMFVSS